MEPRKHKKSNSPADALLRFSLLLGFISLFVWLDMTEQFSLYINPRFITLVQYSYWLLLPLLVVQFFDLLLPDDRIRPSGCSRYIPFCIILTLAVCLPDNTLNASLVSSKGLNQQKAVLNTASPKTEMPRPLKQELQQAELIRVTDRNYTEVMSEINEFPQDYTGKQVTLTGFVFRSPGLAENQLSLVRYVIVCCVADALPYGVMCETDDAKQYPDGTWLTGKGTLEMSHYKGQTTPVLKLTSIQVIKEPEKPYVFPYDD
ncbi:hypothetical protein P22_1059 [Propionispora sp. 2/2-37]|uniref:TIGR03943 family putative permease subunit n=1 Tax=Propionispora sp. 2/2-37 TaxID=1677858 RepID=UPI0006BB87BE|nr:TIGR03943 family protein [Propionispora sp. 2/2-37]CUH94990.1 hypothetical protein P22_1059 [Propionispora sp. 2/2-37]